MKAAGVIRNNFNVHVGSVVTRTTSFSSRYLCFKESFRPSLDNDRSSSLTLGNVMFVLFEHHHGAFPKGCDVMCIMLAIYT